MGEDASFGALLKSYRAAAGLTQEELAERARLSARAISDLERSVKHRPYAHTLGRLVEALALHEEDASRLQKAARHLGRGADEPSEQAGDGLRRGTLPVQPTSFVGRRQEVAEVGSLVECEDVRLLTLTGPGGVGKTRLAVQVAKGVVDCFPDGVIFVSLASLADPALVPATIATAVGITESGEHAALEQLIERLRERRALLLLDNFEHLVPAADTVSRLLASCPRVAILVTSRVILHLAAEHEYPVAPLATPTPAHLPESDVLSRYDAVQLFHQRARAVRPGYVMTDEDAAAIAEICYRLDGLPLAIELAATRMRLFGPRALLTRLSDPLRLLTSGPQDAPSRQQTLRRTIDWSYSLLTEDEKALLARLSVFAGGSTLDAADAVCCLEGETDILAGLTSLVEQSLIREEGEQEPRFRMLETIREYALERLATSGEAERVRQRHAEYFLALAREAESELLQPGARRWLPCLDAELDNLRASLRWLLDSGQGERALVLALLLGRYWETRAHHPEARKWLHEALQHGAAAPPLIRARGFRLAARLATQSGAVDQAAALGRAGLLLFREAQDLPGIVGALMELALAAMNRTRYAEANDLLEECLEVCQRTPGTAWLAGCFHLLGEVALNQGEYDRAVAMAEESIALTREQENQRFLIACLDNCARALLCRGELDRAVPLWAEGLQLARQWQDKRVIAYYIEGMASAAAQQDSPERAGRLWGAAQALREEIHCPLSEPEAAIVERFLRPAKFDKAVWNKASQQGKAMTLEDAIAYAFDSEKAASSSADTMVS